MITITEARVEIHVMGGWERLRFSHIEPFGAPLIPLMSIPEAIIEGRAARRYGLEAEVFPDAPSASPIRVVDSAGAVVAQWGTP